MILYRIDSVLVRRLLALPHYALIAKARVWGYGITEAEAAIRQSVTTRTLDRYLREADRIVGTDIEEWESIVGEDARQVISCLRPPLRPDPQPRIYDDLGREVACRGQLVTADDLIAWRRGYVAGAALAAKLR